MKALGIIAMVVAIVSIFVPIVGVYLTLLAAALAAFAAGEGFVFALVAIGVNVVSLLFLSPMLWVANEVQKGGANEGGAVSLAIFLLAAQALAAFLVVRKNKKLAA
jgi:hypothetical protein